MVVEQLLEGDDLTGDLVPARQDDVEGVVEDDLLAALELVELDLGVQGDAHLAAAGEHVDGAVVVGRQERAVRRRGLGELLDLLAQVGDLLARLPQRVGELLVLRHRLGQLALGFEQALFEGADALRRVLELAPELDDLFLQRLHLLEEPRDLLLVGGQAAFVLRVAGHDHLLPGLLATYTNGIRSRRRLPTQDGEFFSSEPGKLTGREGGRYRAGPPRERREGTRAAWQ